MLLGLTIFSTSLTGRLPSIASIGAACQCRRWVSRPFTSLPFGMGGGRGSPPWLYLGIGAMEDRVCQTSRAIQPQSVAMFQRAIRHGGVAHCEASSCHRICPDAVHRDKRKAERFRLRSEEYLFIATSYRMLLLDLNVSDLDKIHSLKRRYYISYPETKRI